MCLSNEILDVWKKPQGTATPAAASKTTSEPEFLDEAIVKLLVLDDEPASNAERAIHYSTADYLELVDWSGRAIIEGKKGHIPENLPPILQRLKMSPEHYLAFIKKQHSPFANVLGALDKIQDFAKHFEKSFMKGQTAAAALFSPGK